MTFKQSDIFLINRDEKSYTITAGEIENIVNPKGVIGQPDITNIIQGQGMPVQLSRILLSSSTTNASFPTADVVLTLENDINISLIPSYPEQVESTNPYIPITTSISDVVPNGNEYTCKFNIVNYDFKLFKLGDYVKTMKTGLQGKIIAIDIDAGSITIESLVKSWLTVPGDRFEIDTDLTDPITAKGRLLDVQVVNGEAICLVETLEGVWINKYNNRNQNMTINSSQPRGGFEVDSLSFTFEATPFYISTLPANPDGTPTNDRHPVLKLSQVIWYINGKPLENLNFDSSDDVIQKITVPEGYMFDNPNVDNSISVYYRSGNYQSRSERYIFRSSDNPKGVQPTTVRLLDMVDSFKSSLVSMGL